MRISIINLFVDSADTCVERVAERVRKGDHHVPEADVRRRFARSATNFWHRYRPLCDDWKLVYNATSGSEIVASGGPSSHLIHHQLRFQQFMRIANSTHV